MSDKSVAILLIGYLVFCALVMVGGANDADKLSCVCTEVVK